LTDFPLKAKASRKFFQCRLAGDINTGEAALLVSTTTAKPALRATMTPTKLVVTFRFLLAKFMAAAEQAPRCNLYQEEFLSGFIDTSEAIKNPVSVIDWVLLAEARQTSSVSLIPYQP
jgi:hypothetical protein